MKIKCKHVSLIRLKMLNFYKILVLKLLVFLLKEFVMINLLHLM